MFRNNRKWLLGLMLVLATLVLSGCTPQDMDVTLKTEDLLTGNWWEKNVVYYFSLVLDTFAGWFGNSYVLAILMLTIIVRTAILPLTLKQYRSSKAMQAVQPEIKEIQKKYKDNPQKLQEEMMKLYQKHNINPLSGCLPLLVQMPIFIALYNAIFWNSEIRLDTLVGLSLGDVSPWYFLPIIAAITTWLQTKMMQTAQKGQQQMPGMNIIMGIFPIMIFVMALQFPMALPLYWVFSNLYTIVQNYFLYVRSPKKSGNDKKEVHAK